MEEFGYRKQKFRKSEIVGNVGRVRKIKGIGGPGVAAELQK